MMGNSEESATAGGVTRRDVLRRGAAVGGAIAWAVPTVQVLGYGQAFASGTGTPISPCEEGGMMMMQDNRPGCVCFKYVGGVVPIPTIKVTQSGMDGFTTTVSPDAQGIFCVSVVGNDITVAVGNTESKFHVSCSDTPPVQPGYQLNDILLYSWKVGSC